MIMGMKKSVMFFLLLTSLLVVPLGFADDADMPTLPATDQPAADEPAVQAPATQQPTADQSEQGGYHLAPAEEEPATDNAQDNPDQQKKPGFFGRMFGGGKKAQLPIHRIKPVHNEPGRENPAILDPLIRLSKGVTYQGASILPGFYILTLEKAQSGNGFLMTVSREHMALIQFPAFGPPPHKVEPPKQEAALPDPPATERGRGKKGRKVGHGKKEKELPVIVGGVDFSSDGRHAVFFYQFNQDKYMSAPVDISTAWQPK